MFIHLCEILPIFGEYRMRGGAGQAPPAARFSLYRPEADFGSSPEAEAAEIFSVFLIKR